MLAETGPKGEPAHDNAINLVVILTIKNKVAFLRDGSTAYLDKFL